MTQTIQISQEDYQTFLKNVSILKKNNIELDYTVSQPKKRKVKITMNQSYDWNKLDEVCNERL
tara:strand:- start:82 stop:270 length:189 start_codon:yes stop_codon:yes gene_type:complete